MLTCVHAGLSIIYPGNLEIFIRPDQEPQQSLLRRVLSPYSARNFQSQALAVGSYCYKLQLYTRLSLAEDGRSGTRGGVASWRTCLNFSDLRLVVVSPFKG